MHAKFHNNRYKTVRRVALTRGTNCLYIKGEKCKVHNVEKFEKKKLTIISKPHAHPHTMKKTYAKFQSIGTKLKEEFRSQEVPIVYKLRVNND